MKLCNTLLVLILIELLGACSTEHKTITTTSASNWDSVLVRQDFQKYFDNCKSKGSVAIYDNAKQKWIVSDTVGVAVETLPASTFKIINLLIALETKTISDENDVVKWVGKIDTLKYGYRPDIYHDMTVKEAFKVSAGWVFVELSKKIGRDNYMKYLTTCKYGNHNLTQKDDDFWNFGAFGITPMNQVEFIKKLYEEKLPFSKRNIAIVKKVMITEQNVDYTIRSKTGWTRENGINTGWWVGYVENKNGAYFFATRLLQDRKYNSTNFGNCRIEITESILKDLNILK
ncbi:MAG: penicillin-binding transpeptidase domain-containing protein [Candidatus Kapaibacterium sp.]